ncbi:MARTX multifunctional-autoprocessing repeats-in-toxin holotoxin RtxA [Xenorhabdus sp. PB62.4]|uniref:MARTX multifunctional-autoprocessing repeats-in-toxin holotoxin RtxA n=1 Tax=Xenorhabdus sp. PB62.4 TaxID=1851573 RepID=UPI0016573C7D|nr:MARTX multifunctional-autoprocessing repeats-in-toxin holotoxin RtxA [Xenorhabdus sp. PB62.4]
MGKPFWRSVEFFVTGNYYGDDDDNVIDAIGIGGQIYAYGGDDHIKVGALGATVYTGSGHDIVEAGAAYLKVNDTTGNLTVKGGAGYAEINKSANGSINFAGVAGGVSITHTGNYGDITYAGGSVYNSLNRKGLKGNIRFDGAGGYNTLWHETNQGNLSFNGAGAGNVIDRTWFDKYQGSQGDVTFKGVGAANVISSRVETGNIDFTGGGAYNHLSRKGKVGNITLKGAGAYNRIERTRQADDAYSETRGDVRFEGGGGYNSLYSDVAHGNIYFTGAGAYNEITRKGAANDFGSEGMEYAKAEEVVLTNAIMNGSWIGSDHQITGLKSTQEPNTYLFAFEDGTHTKINKVQLRNDPETGKLRYFSTAWYKEGKHLKGLEKQDISGQGGFNSVGADGAYTLSNLTVEQRKQVTIYAVEKKLTENEWVNYGNGVQIDAADITLSDAKMGGYAIYRDGTTVDVKAVKSNRSPNTYVYAKQLGEYTKVVVVELRNDPKTGMLQYIARPWYKEGNHTANLANENISLANGYHYMGTGSYSLSDLHYRVNAVRTTSGRVPDLHEYSELDLFKSTTGSGDSSGDIHYAGAGGGNIIKSNVTRGNVYFYGAGGANVIEHSSEFGNTEFRGAGGANILTRKGKGNVQAVIGGGVNVLTHIGDGKTVGIMLGGANILTKKGKGNVQAIMGGGANVLTHVGDGKTTGIMLGGANILTKVGHGDTTGIMLGLGNVLTHVGDGQTLGIMGAAGNLFTKVGDGTTIAAMVGVGNIFTHVGMGNAWALMGGAGNIFTKVGNGDALALMLAFGNIYTHIGNGTSVALMIAKGNIATKVGNGDALSAMIGKGNIFTQIGHGSTFAAMIGGANVLTKVGDDLTAALMAGKANIYTHVGKGTSIGLFAGTANIMTKVGDGTTLSAMFGKANIMTHVGNGLTGVLALGKANIVTKVGNDFMGVVAAAEANVATHVGDGTTAALLAGKGNILTKVGEGTTVGLLISKIGNIMTHVGDGTTVGFAKGEANIITKVGDGLGINAVWGKANIMTHAGDGARYNFAKGDANIITKVGDGQEVTVVQGEANILTHVGDGDDYTGAWGKANVITKVGDGRNVVLAKGDVNLVTQIGDGDSFNALWSQGNVVTKVGDGMQVTAAKGKGNITTTVGDGLSVTAVHGDLNVNTKVGDGVSVNVAWGKLNVNTRVGDGLNVSVMKGKGNTSIRVGDGLNINASYARNNVAIQVGNGDFYSLAVAESNTQSNKLDALFDNVKQTLLGHAGSQGISYLVNGDEANTSGTHQGRGAINLPEVSSLNGFKLTEVDEITSDLQESLKGSVTGVDTPDMESIQNSLGNDRRITSSQPRNLIVNGDFEQGATGWKSTNGIEASHSAQAYGLSVEGHGNTVSELDVSGNTHIYQDIQDLAADEEITVQFDFARRAGCSDDNGLEVWWNGEVVFAAANGDVKWQNKALTLKAKAGSNRLEFSGIGLNDGLGYVLDNVSATSLSDKSDKVIAEHMQQDKASQNALQDKERAEADKQRLAQEKDKQLAAIAGTQAQLETTDLDALNANGQAQRDAIKDEAQAVTDELMAKARGLEALDSHNTYHGESGQQWHDQFADGLLERVQTELDKASETARNQLDHSQRAATARLGDIKDAVAKSEVGVLKAEQNRQHAKQDVEEARIQAKDRENEAIRYQQQAEQAERDGKAAAQKAEQRGQNYESNYSENIEKVEKSKSHINPESTVQADGGFSEELQYLGEDLNELGSLREVLAHLPVNAGVRTRKASGGSTLTSVYTETPVSQPVSQSTDTVTEWVRNTPKISGLDLSGLKALGEEHALQKAVDISETVSATLVNLDIKTSAIDSLLNQALPFYGLRTERNLLVRESDDNESFEVRPWPDSNSDDFKTIMVEDPDDSAQVKAVERFILANYDNYDQLPEELYLAEDRIISHDQGRTRIVAEKVDGSWNYKPKTDLMSAAELQDAAYVKGKIRGDSYKNVLDALKSYENLLQTREDYDLEAVEKLTNLRHQVEGYLLGHPDSERTQALKNLLSQINVRMEESLVLVEPTLESAGKGSFSDLYSKLSNANLKDSKHLYIDEQGNFVTRGKSNIQIAMKAASAETAVEQIKAAVSREYGQSVAENVFATLQSRDLSKDGKGIDVSGLRKIHQAIEQQLSPVSATLFVWKPSDHSRLGHAALQIGQGRIQLNAEDAGEFNEKNYVSWWPKGGKSSDINHIFDVATEDYPDLRIRWRDLSQPATRNETLEQDVASEEQDKFGLHDDAHKRLIEKLQIAKGVDAKFADISDEFATTVLENPHLLQSAGIPEAFSRPFIKRLEEGGIDVFEMGKRFAETLRRAAKQSPELTEKRIANVIRQFAERELNNTRDFKTSEGDEGRVFRINLAGLDAAAMQAEWNKISQNPDGRYQLLTDNCSSIVAKVLKAGGADKVIGHTWRPKFGVWTPTELFNFAQALQEAQAEKIVKKTNRIVDEDLAALGHSDNKEKMLEKVAIDNDGTPPRDRDPLNPLARFLNDELYGEKEDRRKVHSSTQIILDAAATDGTADKVTLQGDAGRLTGYYHNAAQKNQDEQNTAKKVVLFIHGSGSSAEEQASAIQDNYKKQGVDMLAVNMRGYGSSDGHPSEKGLYQDARTMFRYLVNDRGIKPENIIIHGYSMGGAVAADLARYAERNGQSVSGLLLDRPMPSMTKAITAHEVPNPAGLTGILAKAVNGQFSVEKNLQGISKQTPIMLLTDSEGLGEAGERMRAKLIVAGYQISGEHTFYGHEASGRLMNQYAEQIVSTLSEPQRENGRVKAGLVENMIYTLFDAKSGRKELDQYSFHFTQGSSLLNNLDKLVPEIGNVLLTNGNHAESKEFLEGVCFALSARYLIEERVHGLGGGKAYLSWLTDAVKAYNDNSVNKKNDIHSVEASLLSQYRRQNIGPAIQDLLSMQYSQTQDMSGSLSMRQKANQAYGGKLKANGLTGDRIDRSLSNDIAGYESVMEKLRDVDKTTYMSFMSEDHAMAVVVHKGENQTIWSFYDPNFGIKSFDNYKDFERFMDSFHKGIITGYKSKLGYTYEASMEDNQSFYVNYNTFEKDTITQYDGVWQQARAGEQQYVLRALKEQGKAFKLSSNVTGRVVDYRDNAVTLEVTTKKGEKVLVEVESNNFKQAANLVQSNIDKVIANSVNGKFTLNVSTAIDTSDGMKKPLGDDSLKSHAQVNNQDVNSWENIVVKPQSEGSDSRFSGQIIIQTENDPVAAKAAASLASKHPDSSVIVQLDANGQYRVVYGDVGQLPSGKLRWQIVGHGRDENDITQKNTRISGYSADELALKLKKFSADFKQAGTPDHISLVGCSLIGDDKREGFARRFISALDNQGIRTTVSARSSDVAVDRVGRKYTKDAQDQWVHKLTDNKIVLGWNDKGEIESHSERVRRGISENDIVLSRVGQTDVGAKAQGAIADNAEIFHAPKQRDAVDNHSAAASSNNQLSYSGNIQLQVGDGEFTAVNWGTTNVGIKVGTGGFKSLAFGDNNVMVHIGNGDSKHSVDIAGYQALEGAQLFVGNRNVSFNAGRSNDLIVMLEKSIPTPPLVNPFDGASRISGVLQDIAGSFNSPDWLAKQDQQWTLESAKKYVSDLSGLDLTSSVDYSTLIDLDSQNERSSRGLKSDLESTLNKKYNQWLGDNGNTPEMGKTNRAEKFRRVNEKLVFNFAVGGQGADIQVTTGNWNFMFGDNIQSILDTNLGSLFGLMTQEYTSTGMAKTTFTFSPTDLPRQIKNKLLGNLVGVSADTTLADIFGVDYTPNGGIISRSNQPVDGVAILREMLEIIGEFSGDQLKAFTDRDKLLNSLKAGLKMGADGVKSFAESHGLKAKAPDENQEGRVTIDEGDKSAAETKAPQTDRAFGLTSLNLPNLFATLFNQDKRTEMESLVANLKENLTADLLNMQDKTFDFLRKSGHLQGDGDIHVSLGNYNFNWGGDGKDLGAYLGDNNNFWGGRGDDVFYSVGTSNIFAGGAGNNTGVMMGSENMMFGGAGNDVAVLAGRINYAYMGAGDDQVFVFGEGGMVEGGKGRDYIVASGNFNRIDAGEDQDYVVTIGNNNRVDLGEGNDFATVFGNYNRIDGNAGNNAIKLMGYHAMINGGTGNDHLIADAVSKFSQINGGAGDDLLVLGGYQNHFKGGMGVNRFMVSGSAIDNVVEDIKQGDKIIFNNINWQNLWFQRSGYDLVLLTHRNVRDTSAQGQFEAMGSVTFNNYFNGNRADIVTQMGDKDAQGEREYTALSANAVDSLVQAMSGFAPNMGDSGFFDSLDNQTKSTIITAWSDTTNGKSKLV